MHVSGYIIGIALSLTASTLESTGYCIWRVYHTRMQERRAKAERELNLVMHGHEAQVQRRGSKYEDTGVYAVNVLPSSADEIDDGVFVKTKYLWLIGFFVVSVANMIDFIALGLTKEFVLTLVGTFSLVVNFFVAPVIVHEKITRLDRLASVCILVGVVLTLCGGSTGTKTWTVPEILAKYSTTPVIILVAVLMGMIGLCVGFIFADYITRLKQMSIHRLETLPVPDAFFVGTMYCILSALCADVTIVLGKASSIILFSVYTHMGHEALPWAAWAIVGCFGLAVSLELVLIDLSLTLNAATYHIPMFYVVWVLGSIVTGEVFYDELVDFSLWRWIVFCSGIFVLMCGFFVINLSARRKIHEASLGTIVAELYFDKYHEYDVKNFHYATNNGYNDNYSNTTLGAALGIGQPMCPALDALPMPAACEKVAPVANVDMYRGVGRLGEMVAVGGSFFQVSAWRSGSFRGGASFRQAVKLPEAASAGPSTAEIVAEPDVVDEALVGEEEEEETMSENLSEFECGRETEAEPEPVPKPEPSKRSKKKGSKRRL